MAAATAGGFVANKIGAWYHGHPDAYVLHKLAHALNGAGMAAIRGGDERSMLSGAAGAVMTEMLMEGMIDKDRLMVDTAGGVGKVTDERLVYNPVTGAVVPAATVEGIQFERNLAHILGAATGIFVGGDVDMASLTASNAVDNNFLFVAALLALDGLSLYDTYQEEGGGACAKEAIISGALWATPWAKIGNWARISARYADRGWKLVKGIGLTGTSKVSAIWDWGPVIRGGIIEGMLGQNLHKTFPVIDKFISGIATSIKSIDLRAATYQNPTKLRSVLTRYVDKVADFQKATHVEVKIIPELIRGRSLELAIPHRGTAVQREVLRSISEYASSRGVQLITHII